MPASARLSSSAPVPHNALPPPSFSSTTHALRIASHSHIKGLRLSLEDLAAADAAGFIGQTNTWERTSSRRAGSLGVRFDLLVTFCPIVGSEVYSTEVKKTSVGDVPSGDSLPLECVRVLVRPRIGDVRALAEGRDAGMSTTFQYIEFGEMDEDELTAEGGYILDGNRLGLSLPNPNPAKTGSQQSNSLGTLLATKDRRIVEELTKLRECCVIQSSQLIHSIKLSDFIE
ncbi:hypothetical protein DFH11DRAFT_1725973 [Phellopilus nigrolimitatus]|nr:hypothetical protein DFH11DRAFT_1725973 [Phellopilus nigrolimitatus]